MHDVRAILDDPYKREARIPNQQKPSASIHHLHRERVSLRVLLLLRTLDLRRSSESLLSVLALLAYNQQISIITASHHISCI